MLHGQHRRFEKETVIKSRVYHYHSSSGGYIHTKFNGEASNSTERSIFIMIMIQKNNTVQVQ